MKRFRVEFSNTQYGYFYGYGISDALHKAFEFEEAGREIADIEFIGEVE